MKKISSLKKTARIAGFLYLIFFITYVFAVVVQSKLIVRGSGLATVNNIINSKWLFRIGFVSEAFSAVFFLLAAWGLYVLLKPVNKKLALLFVLLNLGGVAVQCTNILNHIAVLVLVSDADYLKVLQSDQLQSLVIFFNTLYRNGFIIAMIFYGAWLFPLGYLVFKSGFLPRILGILLFADGLCVIIYFFQFFFFPSFSVLNYFLFPIMFIAEISLCLWLLIKGVKVQQLELN